MSSSVIKIWPGTRVRTLLGETDSLPDGSERLTPPGTWGHIASHNHADHWDVVFPNGAWLVITEGELQDSGQYMLASAQSVREHALSLKYGLEEKELTILDDEMIEHTQAITCNPNWILDLDRS